MVHAWVVCKLHLCAVNGGGRTDVDLLRAERRHRGSEWCVLLRLPPSQSIPHRQRRPTCTPSLGAERAHHRAAELNSMIICEYSQGPSVHRGHMLAQSPRWGWGGAHWGRGHRHWCLLMLILVHLISIPLMDVCQWKQIFLKRAKIMKRIFLIFSMFLECFHVSHCFL